MAVEGTWRERGRKGGGRTGGEEEQGEERMVIDTLLLFLVYILSHDISMKS